MSNEIGEGLREAFIEMLDEAGTDCHAAGETRKALIQEKGGVTLLQFADEFSRTAGRQG
jgi:hypothetical protein